MAFSRWSLPGARAALYLFLGGKETDRPPNVVFIMADDLGCGELGSYGQQLIRTPHLDRMARDGMRFTQFYSASTLCGPAREALMLGRHTGRIRHTNVEHPMRMDDVTVAEVLRAQGYAIAMIGKWCREEAHLEEETRTTIALPHIDTSREDSAMHERLRLGPRRACERRVGDIRVRSHLPITCFVQVNKRRSGTVCERRRQYRSRPSTRAGRQTR